MNFVNRNRGPKVGDRVKTRIQETVGRTLDRRERYKALNDLNIHPPTADPYVRALWEQDPVAPATVGAEQDVIVAPEGPEAGAVPAPEGPMKPPEELGDMGEEPADPDEEKRRALFNTLSELIDLGRVERDEADIRQYADEHSDEVGEMGEVLDDVIEMLVIDSQIYRDPQTFDVESTPGDKSDRGEMKPGVGQQVPTGSTVTTMIASDQTKPKGDPIQEILDGKDVDEVLSEAEVVSTEGARRIHVRISSEEREEVERRLERDRRVIGIDTAHVHKGVLIVHLEAPTQEEAEDQVREILGVGGEPTRGEAGYKALFRSLTSPPPETEESVTEQMEITRASAAVELTFGKKEEAMSAKGALLQYKGVDSVQETKEGGLVVFTTDTDPDEARTRIETIMANARIPMEGMNVEVYRPVMEAVTYIGAGEPMVRVMVHVDTPEEVETVERVLEAEGFADVVKGVTPGEVTALITTDSPLDARTWVIEALRQEGLNIERALKVEEYRPVLEFGPTSSVMRGRAVPPISHSYQGPDLMPTPLPMGHGQSGADLEQDEEPVAPGGEEKYLKPFYEPDGEEEPMVSGEGLVWRMDVPEDPEEFERLAEVLNKAKDSGLIVSWTRMGGPEEEPPLEEPESEVLDLRDADIDVAVPTIESEKKEQAPEDLPPGVDLEPGDAFGDEIPPMDEVPPEEEPEEEYIAVEFAPETEPDERAHFPEWVAAETEDPETGEGAIMVGGWAAADEEEPTEEPPPEDEIDLEEPVLGEGVKIAHLASRGTYFEVRCDTIQEAKAFHSAMRTTKGTGWRRLEPLGRGDKLVAGEMVLKDEEATVQTLHRVALEADLELTEQTGSEYQRRQELQKAHRHAIKHAGKAEPRVRVKPSLWKAAAKKPGAPELPADVQKLVTDYRAAMASGDADLAQRIKGELEFELQGLGVDPKTVLGEDVEVGGGVWTWILLGGERGDSLEVRGGEVEALSSEDAARAAVVALYPEELNREELRDAPVQLKEVSPGFHEVSRVGDVAFEISPVLLIGVGPQSEEDMIDQAVSAEIISHPPEADDDLGPFEAKSRESAPESTSGGLEVGGRIESDELQRGLKALAEDEDDPTLRQFYLDLALRLDQTIPSGDVTIHEALDAIRGSFIDGKYRGKLNFRRVVAEVFDALGESTSDFPEGSRGQDGLEEQKGEWPGVTPRVDAVVVRRGASPEEILLKVEGPKVIVRSGGTWNVDPASYVVHVAGGWLKDKGQEARVRRVNPDTVQVTVDEEKDLPEVLKTIHAALENLYADVSGYGITEPLQRPAGLVRRAFRRLVPFKFEGGEDA